MSQLMVEVIYPTSTRSLRGARRAYYRQSLAELQMQMLVMANPRTC